MRVNNLTGRLLIAAGLLAASATVWAARAPIHSIVQQQASTTGDSSGSTAQNKQDTLSQLPVQQRLRRLENQMSYLATVKTQIDKLHQQLADLRGQLEASEHKLEQKQAQHQQIAMLSERLSAVEAKLQMQNAGQKTKDGSNSKSSDTGSAQKQFDRAHQLLVAKKYDQALMAFNKFINQHGDSDFAGQAHYWLGELYLVKGQPKKAKSEFKRVAADVNNIKAPSAMFNLATMAAAYGQNAQAKQWYHKLVSNYAGTKEAKLANKRLTQLAS